MNLDFPVPLADRVIILADQEVEEKKSGFAIPDELKEKPKTGTVQAVGKGAFAKDTGVLIPMELKKGDRVLFGRFAGAEIAINGISHSLMKESDVVCKI